MKRTAIFLTDKQRDELRSLGGQQSEHVRRAIDEYIERRKPSAITSPSKRIEVVASL